MPPTVLQGDIPNGMVYRFTPKELSINTSETVSLTLFPNPVQEELYLRTNRTILSVALFDVAGRQLPKLPSARNTEAGMLTTLDVSSLPQGIYLLQIETVDGIASQKFVKR